MRLDAADRLFLGSDEVDSVYLDDTQVYPTGYDPLTLPDLKFWLEADQIEAMNNDDVEQWPSLIGTPAIYAGGKPKFIDNGLNGNPIMRFVAAGGQKMRLHYTPNGTHFTMWALARLTGGANGRVVGSIYPDNQNWLLGWWNGFENVMYANGFVRDQGAGGTEPTTNWHLYVVKGTGALTTFWDGETLLASNANGVATPGGGLALSGYGLTGNEELSNCEIAAVGLCEGAADVPDEARDEATAYLQEKYGV